jgi:hypothetical protein
MSIFSKINEQELEAKKLELKEKELPEGVV